MLPHFVFLVYSNPTFQHPTPQASLLDSLHGIWRVWRELKKRKVILLKYSFQNRTGWGDQGTLKKGLVLGKSYGDPSRKNTHFQKDGLQFPTVPAAVARAPPGEEDFMGGHPLVGHTLVTLQHPDDDIRQAVLGLERGWRSRWGW